MAAVVLFFYLIFARVYSAALCSGGSVVHCASSDGAIGDFGGDGNRSGGGDRVIVVIVGSSSASVSGSGSPSDYRNK